MPLFNTQKKPRVLRGFFLRLIDTVQSIPCWSVCEIVCRFWIAPQGRR